MTAYELADKLLANLTQEYDCDDYMKEAVIMLRQQADRIVEFQNNYAELNMKLNAILEANAKSRP